MGSGGILRGYEDAPVRRLAFLERVGHPAFDLGAEAGEILDSHALAGAEILDRRDPARMDLDD
ncbi:MAG: hypothetical protein ACRDMA_08045, partial [Solirubrobacterales bacterium]